MKLHEIIEGYEHAGVSSRDLGLMVRLSKAGFEPDDVVGFADKITPAKAVDYHESGVETVEGMLDFQGENISPREVSRYSQYGFSTVADIKTIKEKELDEYGTAIKVFSDECGFRGNLDAIVSLTDQGIGWCYAWTLSRHGLKGDKDKMLEIGSRIGSVYFNDLVRKVANKLSGNIPHGEQFDRGIEYSEQARRLSLEIDPYDIAELGETPIGKAFLSHQVREYLPIFGDDEDVVVKYLQQSAEDHAKHSHRQFTHELYCQIQDKREEKLFEEYQKIKSRKEGDKK